MEQVASLGIANQIALPKLPVQFPCLVHLQLMMFIVAKLNFTSDKFRNMPTMLGGAGT